MTINKVPDLLHVLQPCEDLHLLTSILLCGNDIADDCYGTKKQVVDRINIVEKMVGKVSKRVAIMELPFRFRFLKSNTEFRPETTGMTTQQCKLYNSRVVEFNSLLYKKIDGKEDLFFLPIKGLKICSS